MTALADLPGKLPPLPPSGPSMTHPPAEAEPVLTPVPMESLAVQSTEFCETLLPGRSAYTRDVCRLCGPMCAVGAEAVHRCSSCVGRGWYRICTQHPEMDNCRCRGSGQHLEMCARCGGLRGMIACHYCHGYGSDVNGNRAYGMETPCPRCKGRGTFAARWPVDPYQDEEDVSR